MFSIDDKTISESLPTMHVVKAATGSDAGLFAITVGAPVGTATRPGDRLTPDVSYLQLTTRPAYLHGGGAATAMAEATTTPVTAPATAAASAPATVPSFFNAYWFKDGHWILLPPLGKAGGGGGAGTSDANAVPSVNSYLSMAVSGSQVLAIWVDSTRPGELVVRSLDVGKPLAELAWSAPDCDRACRSRCRRYRGF